MAVKKASDDNFKEYLTSNEMVMVKFYASWCGTCRLMKPKFERLAKTDEMQNVVFLDVDAEANEEARKAVGVNNLPFFATFKNGELQESTFTGKFDKVEAMANQLTAEA